MMDPVTLLDPGDPAALSATTRAAFADRYGEPPTTVARAPGRVNLIGEHTDYNAGLVLPVALPHATYAAARARADELVRITSLQQDEAWEGTLAALGPGSVDGWAGYAAGVVWALREAGHRRAGRGPARRQQGAARRRAVVVRGARVLGRRSPSLDLLGVELTDDVRDARWSTPAIRAETEVVGAPTGGMDQTVAVLGEPRCRAAHRLRLRTSAPPVPLDLADHTLLVTDTRVSPLPHRRWLRVPPGRLRERGPRARRADPACGRRSRPSRPLPDDRVRRRARHVVTEIQRVTDTVAALGRGDWDEVGRLFDASHRSMRDDFEISCPELDCAVAIAVQAGAVAARMTGGGFGGSSVAVVPDERVEAVTRAVDAAFALEGFRSPGHLRAVPSAGARVQRGAEPARPDGPCRRFRG